jgi:hypothetical protein
MNFDDTPQEAAFRAEAKAWIDANAPRQYEAERAPRSRATVGSSTVRGSGLQVRIIPITAS